MVRRWFSRIRKHAYMTITAAKDGEERKKTFIMCRFWKTMVAKFLGRAKNQKKKRKSRAILKGRKKIYPGNG